MIYSLLGLASIFFGLVGPVIWYVFWNTVFA